jgi:DNA-binding transcriptional LysR family regulator
LLIVGSQFVQPDTLTDSPPLDLHQFPPAGVGTALPWQFQGPNGQATLEVRGNLLASDPSAIRVAALGGQGILFEPTFLVGDDIAQGRLVEIALDQIPQSIPIHAVWSPARRLSSKVRSFVDFLAEQILPVPPWDRGFSQSNNEEDASP